jgi:hypothetical protein
LFLSQITQQRRERSVPGSTGLTGSLIHPISIIAPFLTLKMSFCTNLSDRQNFVGGGVD